MGQYQLPDGWVWTKIGEITTAQSGTGFPKQFQGQTKGDYPFAKVVDISNAVLNANGRLSTATNYLPKSDAKALGAKPFPVGSILFAKIGEAIKLNRRSIAIVSLLADNNVMGLLPNREVVIPEYVFYYMRTVDLYDYAQATTVPSVRKSDIEKIIIPLPPFAEQQRIVARMEQLLAQRNTARAALDTLLPLLKQVRRRILADAFAGRLTQRCPTDEPASVLLERIQAERNRRSAELIPHSRARYEAPTPPDVSDLPELPEGWVWVPVEQIGEVIGGLTKNSNRDKYPLKLPYLRVANVYANELRLDDIKEIGVIEEELKRVSLNKGDLLVVEGNGSLDQIGRVAIWDGSINPCLHQNHIIKVRFDLTKFGEYVLYWFLSAAGRNQITRLASSTSGLYTLSLSKVAALPVPLAPLAEQQRIIARIESLFAQVEAIEAAVEVARRRVEQTEQAILSRAFRGELVPQDPSDEPALVLLERLRPVKECRINSALLTREWRVNG